MIRAGGGLVLRDMIVLAHATHWLEPALLAVPGAVVVTSIVRSLRTRRNLVSPAPEEGTR